MIVSKANGALEEGESNVCHGSHPDANVITNVNVTC